MLFFNGDNIFRFPCIGVKIYYSNYLKEHTGCFPWTTDRATHPNFEGHLLSIDKDTKFPIFCQR